MLASATPFDHLSGDRAVRLPQLLDRVPRVRRMLEKLPLILQNGANLRELLTAVAEELGAIDESTTRLMRSNWYTWSRGYDDNTDTKEDALRIKAESELGRYAALFGISPVRGESTEYLRKHIATIAALHRTGISTAPSILRLVSLLYLEEQPANIDWIKTANDELVATWAFTPKDGRTREIELIDNPVTSVSAVFRGATLRQRLPVTNDSLNVSGGKTVLREIHLTALDADIHVPVIRLATSTVILFVDKIPVGQTLVLRHGEVPLLGGEPIDDSRLFQMSTTVFFDSEDARFDEAPARFEKFVPSIMENARFDDQNARFDELGGQFESMASRLDLPCLPNGQSTWLWETMTRTDLDAFLSAWCMSGKLDKREYEPLLDAALLEKPNDTRADLKLYWHEDAPATFALRIPSDYLPPHYPQSSGAAPAEQCDELVRDLERVLAYGRAAGVQSRIEFVMTYWLKLSVERLAGDKRKVDELQWNVSQALVRYESRLSRLEEGEHEFPKLRFDDLATILQQHANVKLVRLDVTRGQGAMQPLGAGGAIEIPDKLWRMRADTITCAEVV